MSDVKGAPYCRFDQVDFGYLVGYRSGLVG